MHKYPNMKHTHPKVCASTATRKAPIVTSLMPHPPERGDQRVHERAHHTSTNMHGHSHDVASWSLVTSTFTCEICSRRALMTAKNEQVSGHTEETCVLLP